MSYAIALTDEHWVLVADLFDPPGRRGAPAHVPRRQMVDAMLFLARTGCQWRYLPERFGPWTAVWAQWRRWRANGVWATAMTRLAAIVRVLHAREPGPSMVMIDAQTARGARYGPTFHDTGGHGGRTIGTKRTLLVEILGLPVAAAACSARPHDVVPARELLRERIDSLPRLRAIVGDRAYVGRVSRSTSSGRPRGRPASCRSAAVSDRARFRPARSLAPAVALLRGHRGKCPGLARGGLGRLPRLARLDLNAGYSNSRRSASRRAARSSSDWNSSAVSQRGSLSRACLQVR